MLLLTILFSLLNPGATAPDTDPVRIFQRACANCHGIDGTGRGPGGARLPGRNLAEARWQARRPDKAMIASILEGRDAMPSFKAHLMREDAARLVAEVIRPMAKGPRTAPGKR